LAIVLSFQGRGNESTIASTERLGHLGWAVGSAVFAQRSTFSPDINAS
jgi:hypothetical protein